MRRNFARKGEQRMADLRIEHHGDVTIIIRPRNLAMVVAVAAATVLFYIALRYYADYRASEVANIYERGEISRLYMIVVGVQVLVALPMIIQNVFPQQLTINSHGVELVKWGFRHVSIPWSDLRGLHTKHNRRFAFTLQGLASRNYYVELEGERSRIRISTYANAWTIKTLETVALTLAQRVRTANPSTTITDVEGWTT